MNKVIPLKEYIILEIPTNSKAKILRVNQGPNVQEVEGSALLVTIVGPDCKLVKVGDKIICDFKNAMVAVSFEGKNLFLTNEQNVCAVIRNEQ